MKNPGFGTAVDFSGPPDQRRLRIAGPVQCFLVLLVVKTLLITLGFARTYQLLEGRTQHNGSQRQGCRQLVDATAQRVASTAAFYPGRALCLEQSLVLYYLLRRMHIQAVLRLGIQAYPFVAHAWVDHAGAPVNEMEETVKAYVAFTGLPGLPK